MELEIEENKINLFPQNNEVVNEEQSKTVSENENNQEQNNIQILEKNKFQQCNEINNEQPLILNMTTQNSNEENELVAFAQTNGVVSILNLEQQQIQQSQKISEHYISDVKFINKNQILLTSGTQAMTLDIEKNKIQQTFKGHTMTLLKADFNIFGDLIVTGGYDKTIIIWDKRQAKPINSILAHAHEITSLKFSHDCSKILSSSADGFTRIWSLHYGLCRKTLQVDSTSIPSYSKFSRNDQFVLMSTLNNMITLWDWEQSEILKQYKNHLNTENYFDSYFIENNDIPEYVMTYSEDSFLYLYDLYTQELKLKYLLEKDQITPQLQLYQNDKIYNNKNFYLYSNDEINITKFQIKTQ